MKKDFKDFYPGLARVGGMKKPKWDPRHFSWKKKFGAVVSLPTADFDVWTPAETKNQGYTNVCTACMVTGAAEAQFKDALDECFQFAVTKDLAGHVDDEGCDPVVAIKASMNRGLLKKQFAPFKLGATPVLQFANLKNYPPETVAQAAAQMEASYYTVDVCGVDNKFDSIRAAMAQSAQGNFHTPIMVGTKWRASWLNSPSGVIRADNPNEPFTLHAFEITGQKTIGGVLYLRAHLSSGTDVGDHGDFFFPKEIVNNFIYAFAFAPGEPTAYQQQYWTIAQKLWNLIWQLRALIAQKVGDIFRPIPNA